MGVRACDLMQRDVKTVAPEMSLTDLERAFLRERVTGFPVVSHGRLVGIVSRSDVVRQLSLEQSLAELISDYYRDFRSFEQDAERAPEAIGGLIGERLERLRVKDVMITSLISVAPADTVQEVARTLLEHRIHRVLVVEGERLAGIVTTLDIVREVAGGRLHP